MAFNAFSIICLSTGVAVYIITLFVERVPPKKINSVYGYRTRRSKKSQTHWDYAQKYSTIQMKRASLGMILLGLLGKFLNLNNELEPILGMAIVLILTLAPLFVTELELKNKFPEE